MKIVTWNVRSLFWSLKVLHNELSNLDFDVVSLQETRLESGIQKFDNVMGCGGHPNHRHHYL